MRNVHSGLLAHTPGHPNAFPWAGEYTRALWRVAWEVRGCVLSGRKPTQRGLMAEMRAGRWTATFANHHFPEHPPVRVRAERVAPGQWRLVATQ